MNKLLIGKLNINSISIKFDQLKLFARGKVDILVITETKLDPNFPASQFLIESYSEPYRFDTNRNGGGVLIYVQEDIPGKPLTDHKLPHDIKRIFVELSLRKNKWLLFGSYHPSSQSDAYFFNHIKNDLDIYSKFYDKYMFVGTASFANFFLMNARNNVEASTCFKSLRNPSCIDIVIQIVFLIFKTRRQYQRAYPTFIKWLLVL